MRPPSCLQALSWRWRFGLWYCPKETFSASEKRDLAEFPETSAETVLSGKFGKDFETYFADHFPVRNLWVGVNAYTTLAEGNNGANGVYYGKDNYLINKPISTKNQLDHNLGILTDFKQELSAIRPMTAMLCSVYGYRGDKLPLDSRPTIDDEYFFEKVAESLKAGGIGFMDLRETFKTAHQERQSALLQNRPPLDDRGCLHAYVEYCNKIEASAARKGTL